VVYNFAKDKGWSPQAINASKVPSYSPIVGD